MDDEEESEDKEDPGSVSQRSLLKNVINHSRQRYLHNYNVNGLSIFTNC